MITHSMGSAYSKGLLQALLDQGLDPALIAFEANFAPFQPKKQKALKEITTMQFSHEDDGWAGDEPMPGAEIMDMDGHFTGGHSITSFEEQIRNLPAGSYKIVNGQIQRR